MPVYAEIPVLYRGNVGKCIFCSDTHFYFVFESTLAEQAGSLVIKREVEADPEIGEGQGHHVK